MPATTAAERLSSFGSRTVKRLFRSTSEVTLALPTSLRKISRSASQCPKLSRFWTSAGRFSIQRWRGIGVPRGRRPWRLPRRRRALGSWGGGAPPPAPRGGGGGGKGFSATALLAALRGVDVAVDGLVADGRPPVRFLLEPAGDLLRRPAVLEPPDHVLTQGGIGGELPTPLPASPRQVLGVQGEVAAEAAVAVAEAVPAQLAVDGGGVSPEPGGDLAHGGAGLDEAEEGASLVEVELAVGPGQEAPPRCNPLGRLRIRTSR